MKLKFIEIEDKSGLTLDNLIFHEDVRFLYNYHSMLEFTRVYQTFFSILSTYFILTYFYVLHNLSLDWSSSRENLKCMWCVDLTLNCSFANMVLLPSGVVMGTLDILILRTCLFLYFKNIFDFFLFFSLLQINIFFVVFISFLNIKNTVDIKNKLKKQKNNIILMHF
jgi:hypothetical protein